MPGHERRPPEATDTIDIVGDEGHMRGELVRQPANLASAHGIRLPGQRERPLAAPPDAAPEGG